MFLQNSHIPDLIFPLLEQLLLVRAVSELYEKVWKFFTKTSSHLISEVKHRRAELILGWVTTHENCSLSSMVHWRYGEAKAWVCLFPHQSTPQRGLCESVCHRRRFTWNSHPAQSCLWINLGGKPKWLPLNFGYNEVMHTHHSPLPNMTGAWAE